MRRESRLERHTRETKVAIQLSIDGRGKGTISTGIGFLDHMLTLFACHGFFDLDISAKGDLYVDFHHTVEDVAIVLGDAFNEALGDLSGIRRFGSSWVPMDESLAHVCIDIGGRPYTVFNCRFKARKVGSFDTELIEEFFRALSNHLGANIHVNCPYGRNSHHMAEAIFKALGRAMDQATSKDERIAGQLSTKGKL